MKCGEDPEYIEIKHVANKVLNIKTRGQVGLYVKDNTSICTNFAKAGHKVQGSKDEQVNWIMKHYEDSEIYNYSFTTLVIQDIIKDDNPVKDLICPK